MKSPALEFEYDGNSRSYCIGGGLFGLCQSEIEGTELQIREEEARGEATQYAKRS